MAISIKDPETDALARELAQATGTGLTEAIKRALMEELQRVQRTRGQAALTKDLLLISERAARYITHPTPAGEHDQLLYDEAGLPR